MQTEMIPGIPPHKIPRACSKCGTTWDEKLVVKCPLCDGYTAAMDAINFALDQERAVISSAQSRLEALTALKFKLEF